MNIKDIYKKEEITLIYNIINLLCDYYDWDNKYKQVEHLLGLESPFYGHFNDKTLLYAHFNLVADNLAELKYDLSEIMKELEK